MDNRISRPNVFWNYRVVRRLYDDSYGGKVTQYCIHEAYYDVGTKPHLITEDGIEPMGETIDELQRELVLMLGAIYKPALDYETREELPQ